jgi:hypothetical protein
MADIFYEPETEESPVIPYRALAEQVFPVEPKQKLVPFLGAGASLRHRPSAPRSAPTFTLQAKIDAISDELGLKRRARLFMDIAVRLAAEIQIAEDSSTATLDADDVLARAENSRFPPAAGDLADVLASLSAYDTFERPRRKLNALLSADGSDLVQVLRWMALLTDIAQPTAPLLSVSSYYEYTLKRKDLWQTLQRLFANKEWPTTTNFLVARAAHWHLRPERRARKDYLIITTNYDCLMEVALDLFKVPFCVLTVGRNDRRVDVRFSGDLPSGHRSGRVRNSVQKYLGLNEIEYRDLQDDHRGKFPANFTLQLDRPLAVIYKIHGCLSPITPGRDSIILSDEDYVDYLCHLSDNDGMIPGTVTQLMQGKGFLFAGYSFSDWNVRGIYKALVEKRAGSANPQNTATLGIPLPVQVSQLQDQVQDYAVVRDLNVYESAFFRQKSINLLQTELDQFSRRIQKAARKRIKCSAGNKRS